MLRPQKRRPPPPHRLGQRELSQAQKPPARPPPGVGAGAAAGVTVGVLQEAPRAWQRPADCGGPRQTGLPSIKVSRLRADARRVALLKHADPRTGGFHWTGEDSDDLLAWLTTLTGCPPITQPVLLQCERHDEPVPCSYVQADPQAGVARRRCVACAHVTDLYDSGERWTYPDTWSCLTCQQSLAELAAGISANEQGRADWLALAARCVGCGRISGLTDVVLQGVEVEKLLTSV